MNISTEDFNQLKRLSVWILKENSKLIDSKNDFDKGFHLGKIQYDLIKLNKLVYKIREEYE